MNIKIHRGTQEIGGNCLEVSTARTRILVDFGLPLVDPKDKTKRLEIPRFDKRTPKEFLDMGILPDIPGLYSNGSSCGIDGILISHPHQDHYGLLGKVRKDIPVYLAESAKKIIDVSDIFGPVKIQIANSRFIHDKKQFAVGDIKITPYVMDHPAFESMGFLIDADGKKLYYSGDFRAHGRKSNLFNRFIENPPKNTDILLMEGTVLGSSRHESLSESQIENKIIETANKYTGVKLISASGQNIDRIVSFYKAAIRTQSILVIDLYMAYILDTLCWPTIPYPSANFPLLKILYTHEMAKKLENAGKKEYLFKWNRFKIKPAEIGKKPGKAFVFYRNSLSRYIRNINNFSDAVMIYSMYSGYMKEPSYLQTREFLNRYGIKTEEIHTSGHVSLQDLKKFTSALKPKVLVPIHTFAPEDFDSLWPSMNRLKDRQSYTADQILS
jgi:ribonuclease J